MKDKMLENLRKSMSKTECWYCGKWSQAKGGKCQFCWAEIASDVVRRKNTFLFGRVVGGK